MGRCEPSESPRERTRWLGRLIIGAAMLLVGCSSGREARPIERPTPPTSASSVPATSDDTSAATASSTGTAPAPSSTSTTSTTTQAAAGVVTGTAVAGSAGGVEASGPPFPQTDAFSEAVRLSDGSCVGWAGSQGGSTSGLAVGAPVVVLGAEANEEIGTGTIQASRWLDASAGGEQWNCHFDFTATVTGAPAEFRIRVGSLEPWLARPDPATPGTFVASVNSDASIGLIPSCPAIPEPATTATTTASSAPPTTAPPTTVPAQLVSGWTAVGQYWSRGVDALCSAGLAVTAIARPCRPAGAGSDYITAVVDSADPTVTYANGAEVPLGTELIVVVATGRLCS